MGTFGHAAPATLEICAPASSSLAARATAKRACPQCQHRTSKSVCSKCGSDMPDAIVDDEHHGAINTAVASEDQEQEEANDENSVACCSAKQSQNIPSTVDWPQKIASGDKVKVLKEFKSNSKKKVKLREGLEGVVEEIDEDGDACIDFSDSGKGIGSEWVQVKKFHYLCVIQHTKGKVCSR